jgi:hypothetical protein
MKQIINCSICGNSLKGKQTLFCSTFCKNKGHQSYQSQKDRGQNRKKEIIKDFGGKCSICGYKKNLSALTFHHKDPKRKEFKLDIRSLSNRKLDNITQELSKCILVCHNCHSELHHPEYNLEQ